jgi:hypothetical protein
VAFGLAGSGCTIVTSDAPLDGGFFDGASNDDSATPPPNGCNECLFQQCAGSWSVCQNDPECLLIYACATKPGCDQSCVNNCFCGHPTGQTTYVALAACDSYYTCNACSAQCAPPSASCATPGVIARDICGAPPPADAGSTDATTPPPQDAAALPPTDAAGVQDCTACTNSKCQGEKAACATGSECDLYAQCLAGCQDTACFNDCATAHESGKTASEALQSCTLNNCKSQCDL